MALARPVLRFFPLLALVANMAALGQDPNQLVRTICIACHNEHLSPAGLNLRGFDAAYPDLHPVIAEKMIRKLHAGQMPPRDMLNLQSRQLW